MKRFILLLLFAMCTASVRADIFSIDSAAFNDGTEFIGPYNSTWNGLHITSYCVDFTHQVGFGQQFAVTTINLADYTGEDKYRFEQSAFLVGMMQGVTDIPTLSLLQRAIWLITTPGTTDPYLVQPAVFAYTSLAFNQTYNSTFDSQFTLFIRAGDTGQAQIAMVPEIKTISMIGFGLLLFPIFYARSRRASFAH